MIELDQLLKETVLRNASDLHLVVGVPPVLRINGSLIQMQEERLTDTDLNEYVEVVLNGLDYAEYMEKGEYDCAYSVPGLGRFRINAFKQRGSSTIAIRAISTEPPTLEGLNQPQIIKDLTLEKKGLILITGATGSGKSTTLAAMVNEINKTRPEIIITLEDPIEYLHRHNKSIVSQREIGRDSLSYASALRAALREDPDIILIGEMRDLETMSIALTAAETGHLVLSTLHTIDAVSSITRIVDAFPANQQDQIRNQLRGVLKAVISQQLVPTIDNKRVCAQEILINTPGIGNLIKENKIHQIPTALQTGSKYGMKTMESSLKQLVANRIITNETASLYSLEKK